MNIELWSLLTSCRDDTICNGYIEEYHVFHYLGLVSSNISNVVAKLLKQGLIDLPSA